MNLAELLRLAAAASRKRIVRSRTGWAAWTMSGAAVYTSTEAHPSKSTYEATDIQVRAGVRLKWPL